MGNLSQTALLRLSLTKFGLKNLFWLSVLVVIPMELIFSISFWLTAALQESETFIRPEDYSYGGTVYWYIFFVWLLSSLLLFAMRSALFLSRTP